MTTFRKPRQEQKLSIKGLTDIPKLPQDYAQVSWTQLETNLKEYENILEPLGFI